MRITDVIKDRLSLDRNHHANLSNVGPDSESTRGENAPRFDTTRQEATPRLLPIANEFMRSPTMPQSPLEINQGYDYDQSTQRSPTTSQSSPAADRADDNGQSARGRSISSEINRAAIAQRKPVSNKTDRSTVPPFPQNSTVRVVSNQSKTSEPAQDDSGLESVLDILRLRLGDPSDSAETATAPAPSLEQGTGAGSKAIPQSSLEKPSPTPPTNASDSNGNGEVYGSYDRQGVVLSNTHDLERQLGVEGQIHLSSTADTDVQTTWAPAATHETITENVHEIREERITRDIYQDHVYHRILPIEEVELLPTRHYIPDNNGLLKDVTEQWTSRRASRDIDKGIAKGFEKVLPEENVPAGPRTFTAREFHGDIGDPKEECTLDGTIRSEKWWVHPPMLETGGTESGQTHPFHLRPSNPEDDGWCTART